MSPILTAILVLGIAVHAGLGETGTAGITAASAIGSRKDFDDLPHSGILINMEFLRHKEQHQAQNESDGAKDKNCRQNW